MNSTFLVNGALGLLPVLVFLATLVSFDSFKLVRPRFVLMLIVLGGLAALGSWLVGGALMRAADIGYETFARFLGPVIEEALKALAVVWLIRTNRIGFSLDAAIAGFSIGAGFAVVENYFYLQVMGADHPAIWVIRGFGTAVMHGGTAAIFAIAGHLLTAQSRGVAFFRFFPGYAAALLLHAGFNQFLGYPIASTIAVFIGLAAALGLVMARGTKSVDRWISVDYAAQRKFLDDIRARRFGEHPLGRVLDALHRRFHPYEVEDVVRYVELHTELVIAAEELLKARDDGKEAEVDRALREKLARYRVIENEVGQTVRLALQKHLKFSRQEFFELYTLKRDAKRR